MVLTLLITLPLVPSRQGRGNKLDCFAALAMTGKNNLTVIARSASDEAIFR
jgi:hypothetical protein